METNCKAFYFLSVGAMYQKLRKNMLPFQVCIVELGGTIGDIEGMPFVEAFRQFQFRVKKENFVCAHVSMVPQVS